MIDLNQYEILTFDCYGTLIDWEKGVLEALQPVLSTHQIQLSENEILEWFARFESDLEQGENRMFLEVKGVTLDELFAFTAKHLQVEFDKVVTAEQVKSYKPSVQNFRVALEKIGLPSEKVLHVACSVYHDIVPANSLGLSTVWVNRRSGQEGSGAYLPAQGKADLEVPDLKSLAAIVE